MNVHFFGLKKVFSSYSALIAAFEKTKKKYQGKLKKLEFQIQALTERYEAQVMGWRKASYRSFLSSSCPLKNICTIYVNILL